MISCGAIYDLLRKSSSFNGFCIILCTFSWHWTKPFFVFPFLFHLWNRLPHELMHFKNIFKCMHSLLSIVYLCFRELLEWWLKILLEHDIRLKSFISLNHSYRVWLWEFRYILQYNVCSCCGYFGSHSTHFNLLFVYYHILNRVVI